MKRSRKCVGVDVHQGTTVITIRNEAGHVVARTVVATEAEALRAVFRGMRGEIHVVLEEGTQAEWRHNLLVPLVHQVVVCNPYSNTERLRSMQRSPPRSGRRAPFRPNPSWPSFSNQIERI
jgi:hypothetical protein